MRTIARIAGAAAGAILAAALGAAPEAAEAQVPVRARVLEGSLRGPARFDPRLEDLRRQLSPLAYLRWEQRDERDLSMTPGKTEWVQLPNGDQVGITLVDVRKDSVTFEVALAAQNTQSKLSVERGQRIVHQVTRERDGSALFISVHAWP
jgi:predicted acylesterase/phospholipase RssA